MLGDVLDHLFAMFLVEFRAERRCGNGLLDFRPRFQKLRVPQFFKRENFVFRAQSLIFPDDGALFDEINDADEIVFASDGVGNCHRVSGKSLPHSLNGMLEVGADAVHLVDKGDSRHAVLVRLAPNRL